MFAVCFRGRRNWARRRLIALALAALAPALVVGSLAFAEYGSWVTCSQLWPPPCGTMGDPDFGSCIADTYICPNELVAKGWTQGANSKLHYCGLDLGQDEDCQQGYWYYCFRNDRWQNADCTGYLYCSQDQEVREALQDEPGCNSS